MCCYYDGGFLFVSFLVEKKNRFVTAVVTREGHRRAEKSHTK